MATYKVLQDIEAEDKLVGPLTLRQCIYAAIAAIGGWLSYLSVIHGASFMVIFFLPFIAFGVFFAFPWNRQQSTEVWALAKVRFMIKPRKRIWDQSGMKHLVEVTAPKQVVDPRQHRMSEVEVQSRLKALAATVDSRGWAVKNVPLNMYVQQGLPMSDRLVEGSASSVQGIAYKETATDDIFDLENNPIAQQFAAKINASTQSRYQNIVTQMAAPQTAATAPAAGQQNYWYAQPQQAAAQPSYAAPAPQQPAVYTAPAETYQAAPAPSVAAPAVIQQQAPQQQPMPAAQSAGSMRVIQPIGQQTAVFQPVQQPAAGQAYTAPAPEIIAPSTLPSPQISQQPAAAPTVTAQPNPAILELANNNDLNVATIAREAQRSNPDDTDEVVVSLR